ncbi:MAG: PQQ-binding-like beta-propeller repeat protein [Acidobacteriota bacterium]
MPAKAFGSLFLLLLSNGPAASAAPVTPVPVWEQHYGSQSPVGQAGALLASRELGDQSVLLVAGEPGRLAAVRYDTSGGVLSTAVIYPAFGPAVVALDPFGAVFVAAQADGPADPSSKRGDIWVQKFDGLTGRTLWPSPATYDSPSHGWDKPLSAAVDPHGDLIVTGLSVEGGANVHVVLKFGGASGVRLWGYPIPGQNGLPGQEIDRLALDASGNAFVAVQIWYRTLLGYPSRILLVKIDGATGQLLWGPAPFYGAYSTAVSQESPVSLAVDPGGNPVILASSGPAATSLAFATAKYDGSTGNRLWGTVAYSGPSGAVGCTAEALAITPRGDVVISGNVIPASGHLDISVLEYSGATGAVRWGPISPSEPGEYPYPGSSTIRVNGAGDVYVAAQFRADDNSSAHARFWRLSGTDGSDLWGPKPSLSENFFGNPSILVRSSGDLFVAAPGYILAGPLDGGTGVFELQSSTGDPAWGPEAFDAVAEVPGGPVRAVTTPDGNVVVGGLTREGAAVIKYDRASGSVLWGPVVLSGAAFVDLVSDPAGDLFVVSQWVGYKLKGSDGSLLWTTGGVAEEVGVAAGPGGNFYLLFHIVDAYYLPDSIGLMKFSGADGTPLWGPFTWWEDNNNSIPTAMATDANGDVFLAGYETTFVPPPLGGRPERPLQNSPPGVVYKYSGSTGERIWAKHFARDAANGGHPTALVVGGIGNVTVTGATYNGSNDDITTIKYSGADGTTLWGPKFLDGAGHGNDSGQAIALDSVGNVFVAGRVVAGVSGQDIALLKYAWNDGHPLWGPVTYSGPDGGADSSFAVAVDGSGDAVLTGTTSNGPRYDDIVTLEYSGATGSLLWSPLLTGGDGDDEPAGVSVLGSSMVVAGTSANRWHLVGYTTDFGMETLPEDVPPGECGRPYAFDFVARNGSTPYAWTVVSGAPAPGLALTGDGSLIGTPTAEGVFSFSVRVQDSASHSVTRAFTVAVGPGDEFVPIDVVYGASCQATLSAPPGFSSYLWSPGGETTPSIVVSPAETTIYSVLLESSGCPRRGVAVIPPTQPAGPSAGAPTIASILPASGPAAGGTDFTLTGTNFSASATVLLGGSPATDLSPQASTLTGKSGPHAAGLASDVVVTNPGCQSATLPDAYFYDFLDVPQAHLFHGAVVKVTRAGITKGCGGGNYCPSDLVTRAQMAIFLLRGEHGASYQPPPATGTVFGDVAAGDFGAAFIEQLAAEGITTGCGKGDYCPAQSVNRASMAVFLLRAKLGSSHHPPPATGTVFGDVPPGTFLGDWIEELAALGITGGCGGGNYCPSSAVTRGEMAVFLVRTFGL